MKNKTIILTKVLMKSSSGLKGKTGKKNRQIWILILLAIAFAPLAFSIYNLIMNLYDILQQMQQEGIILSMGFTITAFMIFFFGIFYVMNVYYFANDVENLLPLPLKPSEVLGAKFFTVLIYEYIMGFIILFPILLAFGLKSHGGFIYVLYSIVVFCFLPMIPLVLASILVLIMMRFTNIGKHKDQLKVIGGILAIGIGVGVNGFVQRIFSPIQHMSQLEDLLAQGNNSLLLRTVNIFPSNKLAALGLMNSKEVQGFVYILLFVLSSLLLFYLFIGLGKPLYLKGVLGISEAPSKRKVISKDMLKRTTVEQSKIKAYTVKELRLLFRTPIYFLNCIVINFLWPIFFIIPMISQSQGFSSINNLKQYLHNEQIAPLILAGGFAMFMFIVSSNGIVATSISREGENLFIAKYLPISYLEQIIAKVLSGIIIGSIGMLTMLGTVFIILNPPGYLLGFIIITGLNGMLFSGFVGIILDLFNPKLHWDTEQQAVKQNLNVVIHMVIEIIVAALTVAGVYFLQLSVIATTLLLIVVFGIINAFLYYFLKTKGVRMFRNI